MERKLISIIVPIYNTEKYLEKCLESIKGQEYDFFECLLIDDGSKDNSKAIAEHFVKEDSRFIYFYKTNGGLSDARNYGIERAKGEYICFIDSDDYIDTNYLKRMIENIKESDICVCGFKAIDESNNVVESIGNDKLPNCVFEKDMFDEFFYDYPGMSVVAWNKLYKTSLFKNIRYPVGRLHEDLFTTYKLVYSSSSITTINDDLYYYLQRQGSIMSNKNIKLLSDSKDAYFELAKFYYERSSIKLFNHFLTAFLQDNYSLKKLKAEFIKKKDIKASFSSNISFKNKMFLNVPALYCLVRKIIKR